MTDLQNTAQRLAQGLAGRPLLRWVLACTLGWPAGLLLGSLLLRWLGAPGLLLGGAAAGVVAGGAQWLARRRAGGRRWLALSALGGMLGTLAAGAAAFTLLLGGVGLLVMGALFGAVFGALQWPALRDELPDAAALWVLANAAGGACCALLTLEAGQAYLPALCSPGPPLFGLLTGWTLLRLATGAAEDQPD